MFNIVQRRKWFFLFSGIIIVAGLIAQGYSIATYPEHSPFRLGIDFIGGSLLEFAYKPLDNAKQTGNINEDQLLNTFHEFNLSDIRIQRVGDPGSNHWQVRTSFVDDTTSQKLEAALNDIGKPVGLQIDPKELSFNQVSPTVGGEVTRAAIVATLVASAAVLGWIVYSFR